MINIINQQTKQRDQNLLDGVKDNYKKGGDFKGMDEGKHISKEIWHSEEQMKMRFSEETKEKDNSAKMNITYCKKMVDHIRKTLIFIIHGTIEQYP